MIIVHFKVHYFVVHVKLGGFKSSLGRFTICLQSFKFEEFYLLPGQRTILFYILVPYEIGLVDAVQMGYTTVRVKLGGV